MIQISETVTTKEFTVLHCLKCGKEWIPKDPSKLPETCPNPTCRSKDWQKPKSNRKQKTWKDPIHKTRPDMKNKNRGQTKK
jgi:hypothetical protein